MEIACRAHFWEKTLHFAAYHPRLNLRTTSPASDQKPNSRPTPLSLVTVTTLPGLHLEVSHDVCRIWVHILFRRVDCGCLFTVDISTLGSQLICEPCADLS